MTNNTKQTNYHLLIAQSLVVVGVVLIIIFISLIVSKNITIKELRASKVVAAQQVVAIESDTNFIQLSFVRKNIKRLRAGITKYSQLLDQIANTLPDAVVVSRVTTSSNGAVSLEARAAKTEGVADTYRAFVENKNFQNVFVPSMAQVDNAMVFPLSIDYTAVKGK